LFTDIDGLKEGNNIWFSGVKVGTVEKITLRSDFRVDVVLNIEVGLLSPIRKDAYARVGSDGLLGNKIVVIYGGTVTAPVIAANEYLLVEDKSANKDLMTALQTGSQNLVDVTANLKTITRKIADGQGSVGKLISDPALASDLKATASNLRNVSRKAGYVSDNLAQFSGRLNTPASSLNRLLADSLLYDSIRNTILILQTTIASASNFAGNLALTGKDLNDTRYPAGTILHDALTADQLKATIENLQAASHKLDEDLEALQHNFLLRGYFRKKAAKPR